MTNPSSSHAIRHPDTLFIDVRSPAEYASGHLDGAINLPLGLLEERLPELEALSGRDLVLYCASGARSAYAWGLLLQRGFQRVHDGGGLGVLSLQCGRGIARA